MVLHVPKTQSENTSFLDIQFEESITDQLKQQVNDHQIQEPQVLSVAKHKPGSTVRQPHTILARFVVNKHV